MKNVLLSVSFVLWVSSFSIAFATEKDCPAKTAYHAVDMRDSFPPLHDQGDKGWCYADGTADQIAYWGTTHPNSGISLKGGQYPSAVAVALTTNSEERAKKLELLAPLLKEYSDVQHQIEFGLDKAEELDRRKIHFLKEDAFTHPDYAQLEKQAVPIEKNYWALKDSKDPADKEAYKRLTIQLGQLEKKKDEILNAIPDYQAILKELSKTNGELDLLAKKRDELSEKVKFQEGDGGLPKEVLESIVNNGVCPENEIQSDPSSDAEQVFSTNLSQYLNDPNEANLCLATLGLANYFKFLSVAQIENILKHFGSGDSLAELLKSCKKITFPGINDFSRPLVTSIGDQNNINEKGDLQEVTRVLDLNIPVGISYSADVMKIGVIDDKPPYKNSLHYSVVVGKRYSCEKNEPEYLIRNSWGPHHCEEDRQNYINQDDASVTLEHFEARARINNAWDECKNDCFKKMANNTRAYISCAESCRNQFGPMHIALEQPPFECDQGYIWMPESQLKKGFWNGLYVH